MPIITGSRGFDGLALNRLPSTFVEGLAARSDYRQKVNGTVVRLQCFLEITDQRLTDADLAASAPPAALTAFVAAVYSPKFTNWVSPWHQLRNLRRACADKFPELRFPSFPCTRNEAHWSEEFRLSHSAAMKFDIDPELAEFWNGWTSENARGHIHHVRLATFWQRYGAERTRELFSAYATWRRGTSNLGVVAMDSFASWAAARPEPLPFHSSSELGEALTEFYIFHMEDRHRAGRGIRALVADWRTFASALTTHLFGQAWANPSPAIPMPSAAGSRGPTGLRPHQTISRQVLLTTVPLHISDSAAADLLFRDIESDLEMIKSWARIEIAAANRREANRIASSATGIASVLGARGIRYRASQACPEWRAHASATFEEFGFSHLGNGRSSSSIYPEPTAETCWELGLPTPALLLAHAALLTAEHPEITPAALCNMDLFDRNGTRVGYVENDGGAYLTMYKPRKGARAAEQHIQLTDETSALVRDIIRLTQPLRDWLQEKRDPSWRRLMLAVPSMGVAPGRWRAAEATRQRSWLKQRLLALLKVSEQKAEDLAKSFSIRRVRASAGVVAYLGTGSAEEMARVLGHAAYEHRLMDRYLPRAVQDFFNDRYIRLFQTGILCEALKESSYLLEACSFTSAEELNQFLEHHMVRFPDQEQTPATTRGGRHEAQVIFSLEPRSLSVLMSIEEAVSSSKSAVSGHAIKWSRICRKLVAHIETQVEQPEFLNILHEARRGIDVTQVRDLIHA